MGQALYRKYRSKSFDQVIGQQPIVTTLKNAIATGKISHAYLLAGPKGVGKTSVARILAHEVNSLPYTDESIHLDIIEIDAASNRRIDEIRDIREKVHIAPTSAKYKVYIIDEVHMLTKEAFNALLKTLEEPPAHCIFILATTEAHKLPGTIISRTQRFNFKPINEQEAVAQLKTIAKKEKIDIESAALNLLAQHSEGSFRDSLSMLDQLSGSKQAITEKNARELLGLPPPDSISKLVTLVGNGDTNGMINLLLELKDAGNSPALVATQLGKKLRSDLVATKATDNKWVVELLKNLLEVSGAKQPYELLEISLLQAVLDNHVASPPVDSIPEAEATISETKPELEPVTAQVSESKTHKIRGLDLEIWPDVLDEVKKRAASIYTALRLAQPVIDGHTLTLTFQFPLHKNKLEQARHIKLVSDVIEELMGAKIEIKCILVKSRPLHASHKGVVADKISIDDSSELSTISNIFGSAEVLES